MKKNSNIKDSIICILGSLIYCCTINLFIEPMNLYSGGFVGISQLLSLLFETNFNIQGFIYFLINIPLFIFGFKLLGKNLIYKSLVIIIMESIFLSIIPIPTTPLISDTLTNCIIAGCLEGFGCSLTFLGFASGGGTDILGLILSKKSKIFTVGKVSIIINACIYSITAIIFSLDIAIYSLITCIFCSLIIDKFHLQNKTVSVNILSIQYEKITQFILTELDRDATIIDAIGAYSNSDKKLVITILSEYELNILKKFILEIDENAFIYINPNVSIIGDFEKRLSKK